MYSAFKDIKSNIFAVSTSVTCNFNVCLKGMCTRTCVFLERKRRRKQCRCLEGSQLRGGRQEELVEGKGDALEGERGSGASGRGIREAGQGWGGLWIIKDRRSLGILKGCTGYISIKLHNIPQVHSMLNGLKISCSFASFFFLLLIFLIV